MSTGLHAKIVTQDTELGWNEFVNDSKWGDILQFSQWADIKAGEEWKSLRIVVIETTKKSERIVLAAQILYKKASVLGNYAYVPHGPVFQSIEDLERALPVFTEFITKIASKYNFFCLETEPKIGFLPKEVLSGNTESDTHSNLFHFFELDLLKVFRANNFVQTGRNMQPKHKLYYDLSLPDEELLGMCQKTTRYNIKLAIKKGVKVLEYNPDSPNIKDKIKEFYELLEHTQKRAKGYPIRPLSSFLKMFEVFQGSQNLSLFEASFEGKIIAINISQRTKWWSSSFYAASNRVHPEVKAMYLLRWESILAAKRHGSGSYDFWGIIPNSGQHSGYSDHKLSFGGQRVETFGLLALPINKYKFMLWNTGIWLRTKYQDKLRKAIWKLLKK
jgi:peptidoglycan pentaglycine glycine transferase (the first glycine)